MNATDKVKLILETFDWGNYGMDEVGFALEEDPDSQEWIPDLAAKIVAGLKKVNSQAMVTLVKKDDE